MMMDMNRKQMMLIYTLLEGCTGIWYFLEISKKANVYFPSLSQKTPSCNVSVFFLQYSQAHRSSSFHKYFLSVVSYTAKYSFHVK